MSLLRFHQNEGFKVHDKRELFIWDIMALLAALCFLIKRKHFGVDSFFHRKLSYLCCSYLFIHLPVYPFQTNDISFKTE